MIKVTRTLIRPNTDVPFFVSDETFREYFVSTYVETGLIEGEEVTFSEDGLTKTIVQIYSSEQVLIAFRNDPTVISDYYDKSKKYNSKNGIISTYITEYV